MDQAGRQRHRRAWCGIDATGIDDDRRAGTDRALWLRTFDGAGWGEWVTAGGVLASAPTAASQWPGTLHVYALADDGRIWHNVDYTGTWSGWIPHHIFDSTSPVAPVSPAPGVVEVYYRQWSGGADGHLEQRQRLLEPAWLPEVRSAGQRARHYRPAHVQR